MRVNPNLNSAVINDLQQSNRTLQAALQQVSTGVRINAPSDDPTAATLSLAIQAQSASVDQYTTNADFALAQAHSADSVLSSVVALLNQAVTLGTQGANGTSTSATRAVLATNVQGLLSNVISLANATFEGIPLFGGTVSGTTAFSPDAASATGYTYNGNSGVNSIAVGDGVSVQASLPGSSVFEDVNSNVLSALSTLAASLNNGSAADIAAATTDIANALNHVSQQHVVYGNAINQLQSQESHLSFEKVTLTARQNALIGVDPATAAETLSQAATSNSAIFAAAAKVLQNNLLNYLR